MEEDHVGLQRDKQAAGLPQPLRIEEGGDEGCWYSLPTQASDFEGQRTKLVQNWGSWQPDEGVREENGVTLTGV